MKTWKKIVGLTAVIGVALGVLAFFAKKKSMEDDLSDEFDDAFDDFDEEISDETNEDDAADRTYVAIDIETQEADDTKKDDAKTDKQ